MSNPEPQNAVNPLPPVIVALFVLILGIELAFALGTRGLIGGPEAVGWRLAALQKYAFSSDIFDWMLTNGVWPAEHVIRPVTYLFVHGSFTHAVFAGVMLLALGKMVGEVFAPLATLAVFVVSGIAGALVYGLILSGPAPLFGAFPGVYGLIGAFTFLMWVRLGLVGESQIRAFRMIGFLIAIQLLFAVLFGGSKDWIADIAAFVAGFLMSFLMVPGGWARIRDHIRHD